MTEPAGERGSDRSEKRSVVIVDGWAVNLAAEYLELVAKHDDLEVLGLSRTDSEAGECSDETVEEANHDSPGWRHRRCSAPTRDFPSPTGIEAAVKEGYDLAYVRDTIARILGPDHPHLQVLTDMTQAVPTLRAAFTPESLDGEAMTEEIVSLIESLAATSGRSATT